MDTKGGKLPGGGGDGGVMNWAIGIDMYTLMCIKLMTNKYLLDFPGGTVVKNLPANAGDVGSSPGPGRSHMPRSN